MTQEQKTKFPEPFYYLIFQINSEKNVGLKKLFTDLKSFFEDFPVLRWAGWDLKISTGVRYKIDLEGIEYMSSAKRIRVLENGGLIVQGALNGNFLCWRSGEVWDGQNENNATFIHSLALIEFTYSSFVALKKILEYVEEPISISGEIGFSGINNNFLLRYNKIGPHTISFTAPFSSDNHNFEENFSLEDLGSEELQVTVYKVIAKIYRMFLLDEDKIPYVKENSNDKMIDIEQIKNIT